MMDLKRKEKMKPRKLLIDATLCLSLIVVFTVCKQKNQIGQKVFAATLCEEKLSKKSGVDRDRIVIVYNNFDKSNSGLHSDWGFAAWIEKDGKVILFDSGAKGEILAENMKKLDLDPARINHVVISHKHEDHIGGLKYIGQFLSKNVEIHIPAQLQDEQRREYDSLLNFVAKNEYEEIEEGIWITETMRGTVNKIPEQALVVISDDTFVLIVGCSHPGIDKICENVVGHFPGKVPELFTGGSHLSKTDSETVKSISEKIKKLGFEKVAPSHCTGEAAIDIFREEWQEKYTCLFLGDIYPLKEELPYRTQVSIIGDKFYINGSPTFEGRFWQGHPVEGLLPNSRMVQGVFDDFNPETADNWKYPDTQVWDVERNTDEFIEAMPSWREHGLLAFTINMQGGSPMGYGNQDWKNPGFNPDGSLIPGYMKRLEKILDKADELGMVVILGYFYFGQDQFLIDEEAIKNATVNVTSWILEKNYENIIVEIANEANLHKKYDHKIISVERVHELINLAKSIEKNGKRLLVSTSFGGKYIPPESAVKASDFILLHGNNVDSPSFIADMVNTVRKLEAYRPMPIVFNEDDHYGFDQTENNFVAATKAYASWGFFDYRKEGEPLENGFQSVPVSWSIDSERKKAFFNKVQEIFGNF